MFKLIKDLWVNCSKFLSSIDLGKFYFRFFICCLYMLLFGVLLQITMRYSRFYIRDQILEIYLSINSMFILWIYKECASCSFRQYKERLILNLTNYPGFGNKTDTHQLLVYASFSLQGQWPLKSWGFYCLMTFHFSVELYVS